ncbi:daptide biosynthesis intramembrane metalloprotease [Polymorphospora rubra]|uniref:daptide biosynthesis intramembrane metalloprotease n=1 Tax=Polymorphospora rubra TaxID=338584 RepID=UPI0033DF8210
MTQAGRSPAGTGAVGVVDLPERCRLAPDVTVHEPTEEGASWIIQRGSSHYLRVGADVARLARSLDGRRDVDELATHLGRPWSAEHVRGALGRLWETGLLDDGTDRAPERPRRVTFVPPFTVQVTVLRPDRLLTALRPVLAPLTTRHAAVLVALVAAGGLVALAARPAVLTQALGRPLPVAAYVAVLLAFFTSTVLHEFGHGMLLTRYGGRPSRMGVMLFYLAPACFCDVTDAWRLPRNRQRVNIALVGVAVQGGIAGLAALTSLWLPAGPVQDTVVLFSVVVYVSGLLNLVPLVKLDGYLALMSHLDIPYLRDRAVTDARRALARLFLGGRYARALDRRWSVPFGLACMLFPAYLVATGLAMWTGMLSSWGLVGAVVFSTLAAYVVYLFGKGAVRMVREAHRAGARTWRIALAGAVLTAAAAALLMLVEVPRTISGGYQTRDGQVELLLPPSADLDALEAGTPVRLQRGGLATRAVTGSAVVADTDAVPTEAPMTVFTPITMADAPTAAVVAYPLTVTDRPADPAGMAQVDVGEVTLGRMLFLTVVAPWGR